MRRDRVGNSAGYAATQDGRAQPGVGDATDREVQFTRNAANEASAVENRILEAVARPASAGLMLGTMATGGVIGSLVMDWSVAASRLGRWRNTRPDRSMASDCNDIAKVRPARISVTGAG